MAGGPGHPSLQKGVQALAASLPRECQNRRSSVCRHQRPPMRGVSRAACQKESYCRFLTCFPVADCRTSMPLPDEGDHAITPADSQTGSLMLDSRTGGISICRDHGQAGYGRRVAMAAVLDSVHDLRALAGRRTDSGDICPTGPATGGGRCPQDANGCFWYETHISIPIGGWP